MSAIARNERTAGPVTIDNHWNQDAIPGHLITIWIMLRLSNPGRARLCFLQLSRTSETLSTIA
jgi:hypothetical protein